MKAAVVEFPGSNCDRDTTWGLRVAGAEPVELWHESPDLRGVAAVVLPGGFAYGDYLRAGVIARFSPVMRAVADFAAGGGLVLGICNGFQVLAEAGLALLGWEVKALRAGRLQLKEGYVLLKNGEAFLFGAILAILVGTWRLLGGQR